MNETINKIEGILLESGLLWQKVYNPSSESYVFVIQEAQK